MCLCVASLCICMLQCVAVFCSMLQCASMGRLPLVACLKNICLSAEYRSHLALETYICKQPTIRRHPICAYSRIFVSLHAHTYKFSYISECVWMSWIVVCAVWCCACIYMCMYLYIMYVYVLIHMYRCMYSYVLECVYIMTSCACCIVLKVYIRYYVYRVAKTHRIP